MHWYGSILPRIHNFVPANTILEIGPGFGRWSQFLANHCEKLILVDLSSKCIDACKKRFAGNPRINYYVNDGFSLEMIPDDSIDLVFSFDSLVHVEDDVIKKYISQLSKKLKQNGVGVIHHSNLGEYKSYFSFLQRIHRIAGRGQVGQVKEDASPFKKQTPTLLQQGGLLLMKLGLIDNWNSRAMSMTAIKFEQYAREAGLQCISQELINWATKRLIDCISIFTKKDSCYSRENRILRNPNFMKEAHSIANYAKLYSVDVVRNYSKVKDLQR
jgi:SAM-dependent methyltransferase